MTTYFITFGGANGVNWKSLPDRIEEKRIKYGAFSGIHPCFRERGISLLQNSLRFYPVQKKA